MRKVLVVLMVLVLLALAVNAFAQAPGGGGGGGGGNGGGGGRGGGMGGGMRGAAPTPVMMVYQDMIYVELGGWLYKIDPVKMVVVGQVFLTAPTPAAPAQ
jgi:hypothetical protein